MGIRARQWYPHGFVSLLGMTVLGFGLMNAGCAHVKPFEPPQVREISDGPGLFTGRKGALILSRDIGAAPAKTMPDAAQGDELSVPHTTPDAPSTTPGASGKPKLKTPPL
ncbi:hypothetical protein [Candidatus Entotheonella palauensis]|nr:hypothetical protein [Candidatus Entotheonella palauensis]